MPDPVQLSRKSRSPARKVLETIAGERCPCGHMKQRHRKPGADGDLPGEVMGKCRDCDCRGIVDFGEWDGEVA